MRGVLRTAGVAIELTCAHRSLSDVIEDGAAGQLSRAEEADPDIRVTVERSSAPFDTAGWDILTRGAWRRHGQVVIRDACTSGVDLLVTAAGPTLDVVARWRPRPVGQAASAVLRARSRLLLRAVLLQYPALWWSQQRGLAPLHASVCTTRQPGSVTVLIAGPGGVGKSTLVDAELTAGGLATCDNLCVSDGHTTWGLVEPRRVQTSSRGIRRGRRMPHGRREAAWPGRADELAPDCLIVLRRGSAREPTVAPCSPGEAARFLTAGTYMAGELRRYWAFAATLALGTGIGEIQPDIAAVARTLSDDLPCVQVILGERPEASLRDLLGTRAIAEVNT